MSHESADERCQVGYSYNGVTALARCVRMVAREQTSEGRVDQQTCTVALTHETQTDIRDAFAVHAQQHMEACQRHGRRLALGRNYLGVGPGHRCALGACSILICVQ